LGLTGKLRYLLNRYYVIISPGLQTINVFKKALSGPLSIIMINKIYVFWSHYSAIHYGMGKKPLKNGHNGKKDDFPHFIRKSRNNL
jgi:hypothetical protein